MIRAQNLCKNYGSLTAVRDLSFEVPAGEILGFLGPNGAGKSTTLKILSGFLPASAGLASIAGKDLLQDSLAARRSLGYLPEQFAAPPEMRTGEYLCYRARLKGLSSKAARVKVSEVSGRLELNDRLRQSFGSLSRGFKQRVGLADALLADPLALLLDEPFAGLDPLQRREFRERLRQLAQKGCAILFSSHVLPEVQALADRVLVLHRGNSLAQGSCEQLLDPAKSQAPYELRWRGGDSLCEDLQQHFPDLSITKTGAQSLRCRWHEESGSDSLLTWLSQRPEEILEYRRATPDLEDFFQTLVAEAEA